MTKQQRKLAMNKIKFILLFLLSFLNLYANTTPNQFHEHHLLYKIIKYKNHCVSSIDEDKIFIRPENIISTEQGLFIDLNGSEYHPLPLLQFDHRGHFIQGDFNPEIRINNKEKTKGPCPECGINTTIAGICQNPKCWFHKIKVL